MLDVQKNGQDYSVKILDDSKVENVFKYVSKCKNITKFIVEEPSLNEIFIERVGGSYEK